MQEPYPTPWPSASLWTPPAQAVRAAAFGVAIATLVNFLCQIIRLQQGDAAHWLAIDYAMRLAVLLVLAMPPALRKALYAPELRDAGWIEIGFWCFVIADVLWIAGNVTHILGAHFPSFSLGGYPQAHGLLRLFDLTFGLALVAVEEELLFRRAMRLALAPLGDGALIVGASAVLFGAYHWWTGLPNILFTMVFGVAAMLLYRRIGVLWPVIVLHYFTDLAAFA